MLICEELFDYSTNATINGQNGGTGWTAAWSSTTGGECPQTYTNNYTNANISNGTTTYNKQLYAYNEGASNYFYRDFTSIDNTVVQDIYLTFCVGTDVNKTIPFIYMTGLTTDGSTLAHIYNWGASFANLPIFKTGDSGVLLFNGTYGTGTPPSHSVIFKIAMSGASGTPCTCTWYVDEDLNTDPSTWTVKDTASWYVSSLTRFGWDCGGTATTSSTDYSFYDNIRIATTSYESGGYAAPATTGGNFFVFF